MICVFFVAWVELKLSLRCFLNDRELFTEIGVVACEYQPSEDQSFYSKLNCVFLSNQIIFFLFKQYFEIVCS